MLTAKMRPRVNRIKPARPRGGGWRRKPRITPRFVETQGFSCAHSFAMPCVAKNTLIQVTTKDLREPCRVSGRNSRIFLLPM